MGSCGSPSGSGGGVPGGGPTGGGSGGGINTNTSCSTNGARDTAITFNHGHSLRVPVEDFSASGEKTYDIRGLATHSHSVTLSQTQRNTILGGTQVMVISSTEEAHSHGVTIGCAPSP